ncbi:MFS sugar transporter [Purpureocillium lavendulum]|uniref:MFS sugar transporter n=1 Tax=Purpureocillium lavendulum TaxID=1247861 RepID=A0AB34FMM3_9HYPO|nr:MFS sugar transporter [Purpureocillium lavendulum]
MLDENLPTYRLQPSSDNPLHTVLYFAHNGSEPAPEYLLKRPAPAEARNKYALGLLDVHYPSVVYAEVLVEPGWTQPTLSAAEVRASNGGSTSPVPLLPDSFAVSLYNPDQTVVVRHKQGSWGKSDAWDFEVPERSFRLPSASRIDRETGDAAGPATDLTPKVVFRWKRDSRLSKDMTCYMSGRSVGGKKNKEPDITVAMFRAGKNEGTVTIYEPNMARVDVEDRKGLEVTFILSAEVIRDLYLVPRHNPFNASSVGAGPTHVNGTRKSSNPQATSSSQMAFVSGALGDAPPPPTGPRPASTSPPPQPRRDARQQAEIEAETKRLQAMVAEEGRKAREREKRDLEEQKRIKKMLEQEDKERRRREAEVEKETERLRKEYGVPAPTPGAPSSTTTTPALPPRPSPGQFYPPTVGWYGPAAGPSAPPPQPMRPNSVGPPPRPDPGQGGGGRKKTSGFGSLMSGPYGGPAGASVSGFFHRSEEDKRKKVQKKRSVHF